MRSTSVFSHVNRLVFSVRQFPEVQYTTPSAQTFEQEEHWGLRRHFAQLEVLHVAHIMDDALRLVTTWVERVNLVLFIKSKHKRLSFHFHSSRSVFILIDCCLWNTLDSEINLKLYLFLVRERVHSAGTTLMRIVAHDLSGFHQKF